MGYDSVAISPNKEIMIQYDKITDKIILKYYHTFKIIEEMGSDTNDV